MEESGEHSLIEIAKSIEQLAWLASLQLPADEVSSHALLRATAKVFMSDVENSPALKPLNKFLSTSSQGSKDLLAMISSDNHLKNCDWVVELSEKLSGGIKKASLTRNDHDEVSIGEWYVDLFRLSTSLVVAGKEFGFSRVILARAVDRAASSYLESVRKVAAKEAKTKPGSDKKMLEYLHGLSMQIDEARGKLLKASVKNVKKLDKYSALKKRTTFKSSKTNGKSLDKLKFKQDTEALEVLPRASKIYRAIDQALPAYVARLSNFKNKKHFKVLDIARRRGAGTGSLGRDRFYVLIRGYKSRPVILDIKAQGVPANWDSMGPLAKEEYIAAYSESGELNHARRAFDGHEAMSIEMNLHAGWLRLDVPEFNNKFFTVNELSPFKVGIEIERLQLSKDEDANRQKEEDLERVASNWGAETFLGQARAHIRMAPVIESIAESPLAQSILNIVARREQSFFETMYASANAEALQIEQDARLLSEVFVGLSDESTLALIKELLPK